MVVGVAEVPNEGYILPSVGILVSFSVYGWVSREGGGGGGN